MSSPTPTRTSASPPIQLTPRLSLHPWDPSQIPAIAHQANNPVLSSTLRDRFPSPYTISDAENWIKIATSSTATNPREFNYAIFYHPNDPSPSSSPPHFIGGIGLQPFTDIDSRGGELGFWIGQSFWGKGFATELVGPFVRYCFRSDDKLHRIQAEVLEGNKASAKVLERNGFVKEGVRRKACEKRGQVLDSIVYGLLREEVCLKEDEKRD